MLLHVTSDILNRVCPQTIHGWSINIHKTWYE